jgi:hypothetical protein
MKNSKIYLKYLEVLEICETWSRCFYLHLVPIKIISKGFVVQVFEVFLTLLFDLVKSKLNLNLVPTPSDLINHCIPILLVD